jgi:hypothetical protein
MTPTHQEDRLTYYLQSGPLSSLPAEIRAEMLPDDLGSLVKIVQGLLIHVFWAERYGVTLSPARKDEVNLRSFAEKLPALVALDPSALTIARPPEKRLAGNCRDFSNFLAALLRLKGIPARARCGFGAYFKPGEYIDHWVTEYWNQAEARWVMVDAQLDEMQQEVLKIKFNPLDVPSYQFITGGKAWLLCRSGQSDAEKYGILDMHGLWFIRGDLVRDFLALNRLEILPWDTFGLISKHDSQLSETDLALLDKIAGLTLQPDEAFDEILAIHANTPDLRMPPAWIPINK